MGLQEFRGTPVSERNAQSQRGDEDELDVPMANEKYAILPFKSLRLQHVPCYPIVCRLRRTMSLKNIEDSYLRDISTGRAKDSEISDRESKRSFFQPIIYQQREKKPKKKNSF